MGIWGLMAAVLMQAYTSDLISFLTSPRLERMPQTLEELSKRPDLKLSLDKSSNMARLLLVSVQNGAHIRTDFHLLCPL